MTEAGLAAIRRAVTLLRMGKGVPADVREAMAREAGMGQNERQRAQADTFARLGDVTNGWRP